MTKVAFIRSPGADGERFISPRAGFGEVGKAGLLGVVGVLGSIGSIGLAGSTGSIGIGVGVLGVSSVDSCFPLPVRPPSNCPALFFIGSVYRGKEDVEIRYNTMMPFSGQH